MPQQSPLLIVLSGPSGVGKDSVLARLKGSAAGMDFAVTATTRPRRGREKDGVDYHFIPRQRFEAMISDGELLEWAEVYGNLYGVPRQPVERSLERGRDVLVKVDVQGAATIRRAVPQAVLIFLAPPSMAELERRLRRRRTESAADMERRIATARAEMERKSEFDHVVVNDRVSSAVAEIESIIATEKRRRPRAAPL